MFIADFSRSSRRHQDQGRGLRNTVGQGIEVVPVSGCLIGFRSQLLNERISKLAVCALTSALHDQAVAYRSDHREIS